MEDKEIKILGKIPIKLQNEVVNKFPSCNIYKEFIGFWVGYSNCTINLNSKFDKLIFNERVVEINGKLIFVTDGSLLKMDSIEEGYKTIVFISFDNPHKLINEIPVINNWYDNSINNLSIFLKVLSNSPDSADL